MVENKITLPNDEGLINKDAFETIKHLGNISKSVMEQTNNEVVDVIELNLCKKVL
jgi:L-cysteine desulfidase